MEKEKKLKLVGVGMCIPAVIMIIYLIAHPGVILVAAGAAVSGALAAYGVKFIKGQSLEEVKEDFFDDINDLRDKDED